MKALLHFTLFTALLPAWLLPAIATAAPQARTYEAIDFDVPFKFDIGNRSFHPGHYQFLFVGNGLTVMRDAKMHAVASLITRPIEIGYPTPESKIVFETKKNRSRLSRICLQYRLQQMEVVGEQVAMRSELPVWSPPLSSVDVNALMQRRFTGYTH
jgi:hypothetical protein